jgi:hypothetical protein
MHSRRITYPLIHIPLNILATGDGVIITDRISLSCPLFHSGELRPEASADQRLHIEW